MRRLAVALSLLLAGCTAPGTGPFAAEAPAEPAAPAHGVVVAIVDSGINPYHEVFRGRALEGSGFVDATTGRPALAVDLALGPDYAEAVAADRPFWDAVEPGTLYAFRGTNLLAVSVMDGPGLVLDAGSLGHGTATASAVARGAPEAVIVMVEASATTADLAGTAPTRRVAGVAWAVAQPWIDVISLSFGLPVDHPAFEGLADLTRQAAAQGKVVLAAAGNEPAPAGLNPVAGPPWVVAVGGAVPEDRGESALAAKAPDIVSDFQGPVARSDDTRGYRAFLGTSLAAPTAAAEFARAIVGVRERAGHAGGIRDGALVQAGGLRVTAAEVRAAFNATATYWSPAEYGGPNLTEDPVGLVGSASLPIGPAPWLQMGWGYVGPGAGAAAAAILAGEAPRPVKPAGAQAYLEAQAEARAAVWPG